jgi:hypothetical protein
MNKELLQATRLQQLRTFPKKMHVPVDKKFKKDYKD